MNDKTSDACVPAAAVVRALALIVISLLAHPATAQTAWPQKPVSLVAELPNVMVVNTEKAQERGIQTAADFVRYARANPGKLKGFEVSS